MIISDYDDADGEDVHVVVDDEDADYDPTNGHKKGYKKGHNVHNKRELSVNLVGGGGVFVGRGRGGCGMVMEVVSVVVAERWRR